MISDCHQKAKTPSDGTLLGRTYKEVFVVSSFHFHVIFDLNFVVVFIFDLDFVVICRCSSFTFTLRRYPLPFRRLSPGLQPFFTLIPAITEWLATLSFSTILRSSYRERYGFEGAFFTHKRFLPYAPSPTFLTQPAFIKASLGSASFSLKFTGLHADPQNTDLTHLFVCFTAIHKSFILVDFIYVVGPFSKETFLMWLNSFHR